MCKNMLCTKSKHINCMKVKCTMLLMKYKLFDTSTPRGVILMRCSCSSYLFDCTQMTSPEGMWKDGRKRKQKQRTTEPNMPNYTGHFQYVTIWRRPAKSKWTNVVVYCKPADDAINGFMKQIQLPDNLTLVRYGRPNSYDLLECFKVRNYYCQVAM